MSRTGDPDFRCAAASLRRDDPLPGTASTVRAYLLLEHPGPWGVDVLRDARLPDGLARGLEAAAPGLRVLLVRRPGRGRVERPRVFAARAHPTRPLLEGGTVADLREVLDLDLAGLRSGRPSGLPAADGSLFCVCTHGRHDTCCAERGRPLAAALAAAHPEQTWEVSHIGGDRFAGNLLVLPHGLYHGRLGVDSALAVADAHLDGRLALDTLRGRSGLPMPVQAAEIALRRRLGEPRDAAVRPVSRTVDGEVTEAVFEAAAATASGAAAAYAVRVRTTVGPARERLTCRATRDSPLPRHEVLDIRPRPTGPA